MDAREAAPRGHPGWRWSRADALWAGVALLALLAPVDPLAAWFDAAYTATTADVAAGLRILKASVIVLAVAAMMVRRIPAIGMGREDRRAEPDAPISWLIAGVLLLLALGLRMYRLDTELWMDEIFLRTRYAPLEFRQLLSTYDSQNHQPLYSVLARLSFLAAGGADWALRIPAVLLGVGSLWALWAFGRRVTSSNEALLAVLVLTVSYHHVWFSQNARGYTAMLLLTILGTSVFLRLCEGEGSPRRLAWVYAVLMALATYTHLTAALVAAGHALTLLVVTRWGTAESRRAAVWPAIAIGLSGIVTIVLYAPMLPQVWRQVMTPTMEGVAVEWTGAGWMLREGIRVLGQGLPGGLVTLVAAVVVLAVGVVSYWRQSGLTALLMFAPVAVTLVAIIAARHNLWPRFFFFAAGFFVLAAIRGGFVLVRAFVRWHPERVAVAGASAVAVLSLLTVPRAWQPKQQFRAAYDFVERERRPGDEVVALDIASEVYQLRGWASTWRRYGSVEELTTTERSAARTWIVYTLPARLRALAPALYEHLAAPRYQRVRVYPASVGGGEIHILRHDPATGHD